MYGKDYEYARTRLLHTVVRLGDEPVFVREIDNRGRVTISPLNKFNTVEECKLADLNLKPVTLGYTNLGGKNISFLVRVPKRNDWRQGLRTANMQSMDGNVDIGEGIYPKLRNVIMNRYPKFNKAFAESHGGGVAWCREWAVQQGKYLFHRGRHVGSVNKDGEATFEGSYTYLKESFEESMK